MYHNMNSVDENSVSFYCTVLVFFLFHLAPLLFFSIYGSPTLYVFTCFLFEGADEHGKIYNMHDVFIRDG